MNDRSAEPRPIFQLSAVNFQLASLLLAISASAADLQTGTWKAVPATGVEMKLTRARAHERCRVDFDFKGHGGYAIARRDGAHRAAGELRALVPDEGRGAAEHARGEVDPGRERLVVGAARVRLPRDWRRFSFKKRNFEFAWGPGGRRRCRRRIDAIEIVVTAGTGGKGTVWIDDVALAPFDTAPMERCRGS